MLDYKKILNNTKNKEKLSIELKETKEKGFAIFATKNIEKGDVIAYYKCMVYSDKDHESPTGSVYTFYAYRKNGQEYKKLICDIYEDSFPEPINNIPFWAPFVNEPSLNQKENSDIDLDLKTNYKDRNFTKSGDTLTYKLVATRRIRPGEEITWFYGPDYKRDYKVGKRK